MIARRPRARGVEEPCPDCPPDRRQLAHVPRLLRAAHRPGHGVGSGHQRGVRLHVDAREPPQGPEARRPSPWPSTGPSRPSATSASPPTRATGRGAGHPPPADGPRPPGARDSLRIPIFEAAGFEADDIIATLATQGRDAATTSSSSPATATPTSSSRTPRAGALQQAGRVGLRLYDEAGILERTGVTPALYPQYAALRGDPSDNLPGVPGWGRRRPPSSSPPTAASTASSSNLDEQTPKLRENLEAQRGQRPPEPRGDGARPRRAPRPASTTSPGPGSRSTSTRCAASSSSSSSTPSSTGWPRPSTPTPGLPPPRRRARGGGDADRRPTGAAKVLAGLAEAPRRWPAWRVDRRRGRSALEGLALVPDGAWRRRVAPGEVLARRRCGGARGAGRPRRPAAAAHRPSRWCGRSPGLDVDVRSLASTRRWPPTSSTRPRAVPARGAARALRRRLDPRRRRRRRGPARPRRSATPPSTDRPLGGPWPSTAWACRCWRPRRPGPARTSTTTSRCRSSGCSPAWRTSAWPSTAATPGPPRPAGRRRRAPPRCHHRGGRPRVQRQLHAPAARGALRRARPHAAEEDQDRVLHRRRQPREAGRPAPDHRAPARATARWRSSAPPTATGCCQEVGPTAASTPPSTRRSPAPAGSRPTSPTSTTSRCGPSWAASSARPSSRPRGASSWWPTTTRSSCAASPTWPRTRA